MISEKTVELNLSMESINHINYRNNLSVFATGPSQRSEASLGYDVEIGDGLGGGVLIQYKRAIPVGNEYVYHLNYTKRQNQHQILCDAESNGASVLYALPLFHLVSDIRHYRRRLLRRTAWYKPSQIPVPNSGVGKHDFHIDLTTNRRYLTSDPVEVGPPLDFSEVNEMFERLKADDVLPYERLAKFLNLRASETSSKIVEPDSPEELSGQFILTARS